MKVTILVGTMTGTAEMVAQEVQDSLAADGRDVDVLLMDGLDGGVFGRDGAFLICTSTYGQGDVPDNAQAFYAALESGRPDLSGIRYGVVALGDRTYTATYCHGGKRFDALLRSLGARRVGEVMEHDAGSGTMPEDVAVDWCVGWVDQLDARACSAAA